MLSSVAYCSALSMLVAAAAHAGTVLETTSKDLANGTPETTTITYAQDGRMRFETKPGDSFGMFRDDAIYTFDANSKSYVVMDRAAMKKMADQLNPALKQMQEQLAKMPPEQRAQMEKMLGDKMPGMGKQSTQEIRKTSRTGKVAGYSCTYVEVLEDGVMTSELCVTSPTALKGGKELVDTGTKVSLVLQDMMKAIDAPWLKQMVERQAQNYNKIGGIPVLARYYSGGKIANETTLKTIRVESIPSSHFEVPAGYTRKDMMQR